MTFKLIGNMCYTNGEHELSTSAELLIWSGRGIFLLGRADGCDVPLLDVSAILEGLGSDLGHGLDLHKHNTRLLVLCCTVYSYLQKINLIYLGLINIPDLF